MAGHGGRRLGAGAKPAEIKPLGQKFFESIATEGELRNLIRARMKSEDEKISSTAVFWVADHIWGKAKEPVEHDLAKDLKRSLIIDL